MPRGVKKAVTPKSKTLPVDEIQEQDVVEVKQDVKDTDGLVTLEHFAESGTMFIEGEEYKIVDGVVRVKPEHLAQAQEHIKIGG